MSLSVFAAPETMTSAATDLANIGSDLSAAHRAAAPTLALTPAAADEVSVSIAHLFSRYAEDYQGLAGKAAASQEQFVQNLTASAHSYASAEASNAALLQRLTASPASFTSTIAALQAQLRDLLNSVNAALGQLLSSLRSFLHTLILDALAILADLIHFFFVYILPVVNLALTFLLSLTGFI
jgi:ABC-type transporter Mla subunit MlaD